MSSFRFFATRCVLFISLAATVCAQPAPEKPQPDAQFGNWLYKTPDPAVWTRTERFGALIFSTAQPPGDFCTLTLFADATAQADFAAQFNGAVDLDQKEKGTLKIEADTGAKPGKAAEGYDVLTRNLRAATSTLHTLHLYVAGHSGTHFNLAAFQTTSESSWKNYGPQASQFLLSLKLANSLPAADVAKFLGQPAAEPPSLAGFDDAPAGAAAVPVAKAAMVAPLAEVKVPERPLNQSPLVVKNAVIQKDGKPINALKLSQHDTEIYSPSIAVSSTGVIHVSFVEKHRTTYALAAYHRSSSDGGKTWTPAKNLSEDMPRINVGRCLTIIDRSDRVYVIWRSGLGPNFGASPDQGNSSQSNIVYRVLENGQWSRIKNVSPAGSAETQDDGALSFFAVIDAAGRAQVVWNSRPDKWHPELMKVSGTYHSHLAGVGNGLVFQATLDGANPSAPREIFLPPVGEQKDQGGYGIYCDGLDTLNGYVDASGAAHFVAAVTSYHDQSWKDKSRYQLIENGQQGAFVDFPQLSFHGWRDIPTLLVDAAGKRHLVALYPEGEHPNIRDYILGADQDPVIIRETVGVKGSVDGFQAFQGPNGRMVALMQMNDSGERANGETYVSISTGHGWSPPVNVTNNAGRQHFASSQHGASGVAVSTSYYPGPAAGAFDRDGHLLLLMINNEYGLFGSSALGVTISSGSSSTPTLQFLRL
jgi:hypothetical protein